MSPPVVPSPTASDTTAQSPPAAASPPSSQNPPQCIRAARRQTENTQTAAASPPFPRSTAPDQTVPPPRTIADPAASPTGSSPDSIPQAKRTRPPPALLASSGKSAKPADTTAKPRAALSLYTPAWEYPPRKAPALPARLPVRRAASPLLPDAAPASTSSTTGAAP